MNSESERLEEAIRDDLDILFDEAIEFAFKNGLNVQFLRPDYPIHQGDKTVHVFFDSEDTLVDDDELVSLIKDKYPKEYERYTKNKKKYFDLKNKN